MTTLTKCFWLLGNWLAQLVFAFRHGYQNGQILRPGIMPKIFKDDTSGKRL